MKKGFTMKELIPLEKKEDLCVEVNTILNLRPKKSTMEFLKKFARAYQPFQISQFEMLENVSN